MNNWLSTLWHFNIDISVIIITVLLARMLVRRTTKNYNAYALWLAIPLGYFIAQLVSQLNFTTDTYIAVQGAVNTLVVRPVEAMNNYSLLIWTWGIVTLILLLRLVWQHIQLRQELKRLQVAEYKAFPDAKYQVVAIEHKDMSPAVYGFFKPRIYFPTHLAQTLSYQQQQLIIEHEQHHIKQKHLWLNLAWDLLVCFAWFNPLVYFARKNFRHDQELYCDYLVLNKTDKHAKKAYGHALLSTISATHSVSLLCSWKAFNQLEERIMNISKPLSKKGKLALTLSACFVVAFSGAYATIAKSEAETRVEKEVEIRKTKSTDGSGSKSIQATIVENGITYKNDNGVYTIEENGQTRSMTNGEIVEFEKRLEDIPEPPELSQPPTPDSPMGAKKIVQVKSEITVSDREEVKEKAIPTYTKPPEYPAYAAQNAIDGHVTFKFDVDADGKPYNIRVIESEPEGMFDTVAREAIQEWEFVESNYGKKDLKYMIKFDLGQNEVPEPPKPPKPEQPKAAKEIVKNKGVVLNETSNKLEQLLTFKLHVNSKSERALDKLVKNEAQDC